MPHFDRHFSLAEASALLPRIREIFERIQMLVNHAREDLKPKVESPEKITAGRTNGNHHKIQPTITREVITQEINDLVTEIADHGIVIQDIYRGLIDFPAFVQGEEAFLCYELADGDSILFWHPLDTGFGGRQPISEDML